MSKRLILCDCAGSQSIDPALIEQHSGTKCSRIYSNLCGTQIKDAAKEISPASSSEHVIVACLQEKEIFSELAVELDVPMPEFADIRDRAGWTRPDQKTGPKMAALVGEALLAQSPVKMLDIHSEGQCLIFGAAEIAMLAADQLAETLSVTVLLEQPPEMVETRAYDLVCGQIKTVTGSLGQYKVQIDALRQLQPAGRGQLGFDHARDGGQTHCDILLDLSKSEALFSGHGRDGYLRADPNDPLAVAQSIIAAAQLIGQFEKPLYVRNQTEKCAHSRAEIGGCSLCIDNCGSSAITTDGDYVKIDPGICSGCGDCVALCPSGALEFEAPNTSHLFKRIQVLASTYLSAGGADPVLLVHDAAQGAKLISYAARYGDGLPGAVIPLELESTALFGHAEMLAALAVGFARVDVLLSDKAIASTQENEANLARTIGQDAQVRLLRYDDPDLLSAALYDVTSQAGGHRPILAQGSRRQVARLAAKSLNPNAENPIPLPDGAPYGTIEVDTEACTLCLSCVSLCPAGALADNPDRPELRFAEDACLQCGLCTRACPENALTLTPQFDLSDDALNPRILHEEEPFACISCGALFGVKSTVEKVSSLLAGKHSMFATPKEGKLIQMCDKCRVEAQYHSDGQPFQGADRPKVVTTDDYFDKPFNGRKDH